MSCYTLVFLVPEEGLEPSRGLTPTDFLTTTTFVATLCVRGLDFLLTISGPPCKVSTLGLLLARDCHFTGFPDLAAFTLRIHFFAKAQSSSPLRLPIPPLRHLLHAILFSKSTPQTKDPPDSVSEGSGGGEIDQSTTDPSGHAYRPEPDELSPR